VLDTKSKKMRNLKVLLITLTILLPAIVLVALYPRMGQAYEQKIKEFEAQESEAAALEEAVVEASGVSGTDSNTDTEYVVTDDYLPSEEIIAGEYLPNEEITAHDFLPNEQISEKVFVDEQETIIAEATEHVYYVSEEQMEMVEEPELQEKPEVLEESVIISEPPMENPSEEDAEYELGSSFVNYAVESSYYLYGQMLQDEIKTAVDFSILDHYGWINDYYTLAENSDYHVEYMDEKTDCMSTRTQSEYPLYTLFLEKQNAERREVESLLMNDGYLGYMILQFDEYGNISDVRFNSFGNIICYGSLYQHAKESISQYENNVFYYNDVIENGKLVDANELRPKNFRAVFVVDNNSQFTYYRMGTMPDEYHNPVEIFVSMGVEWLILIAAVFVALMAFILPFFKKLDTGWEKIFSIPGEIMCVIAAGAIGGFFLMFEMTAYSCYPVLMESLELYGPINIIGYDIAPNTIYYIALGVNFIGWALVFFLEYISVTAVRQFLFRPIFYLKNRLIVVMICRWFIGLCKKAYHYVTDINIGKGLNKSILKIVIANAVIVAIICCFWFMGWFGVIAYSIILYVLLRKYGYKLQSQYESVLHVTKEMAEGNLKTEAALDLGVFTELGDELRTVQAGFSKAVAEEAKSQNMKTELITNVSHDLKTPLTAIITYVDLLKKEDITAEERREYVETLDKKSQRLKVLIEDLFEVSKASTNNITMYYTDIDLVNLLKQVCLENEDKIAESTLDFRWKLPEKKCVAHLDPNRTYRIIDNLLQNALKYSMPHSRVYVDMEEWDNEYVIRFKNMSAVEMNFDASEITERFVRGDLSRNTEGSGLGLAIAQSFTELQGGKFEVDIDGDLFKVTLRFLKSMKESATIETE